MSNKFPRNTNLGPRARSGRSAQGNQLNINLQQYQISFDKDAFTQFIRSQGIRVVHQRAIPDPTGMGSRGDSHAVTGATRSNSDGFLYKDAGMAHVLFSNNSDNWSQSETGYLQYATAFMTLPDKYDNSDEPFIVAPNDRLYVTDVECRVINVQYIESNSNGIDRLQFPATSVEFLVDANGVEYKEGADFILDKDGNIQWTSQKRPGGNPHTGKGTVYTIRYRYVPFFIVGRILHEIRISQITDVATMERKVERMPYQVMVVREYVFEDVNNDSKQGMIDMRFQQAPGAGGAFGPK